MTGLDITILYSVFCLVTSLGKREGFVWISLEALDDGFVMQNISGEKWCSTFSLGSFTY